MDLENDALIYYIQSLSMANMCEFTTWQLEKNVYFRKVLKPLEKIKKYHPAKPPGTSYPSEYLDPPGNPGRTNPLCDSPLAERHWSHIYQAILPFDLFQLVEHHLKGGGWGLANPAHHKNVTKTCQGCCLLGLFLFFCIDVCISSYFRWFFVEVFKKHIMRLHGIRTKMALMLGVEHKLVQGGPCILVVNRVLGPL